MLFIVFQNSLLQWINQSAKELIIILQFIEILVNIASINIYPSVLFLTYIGALLLALKFAFFYEIRPAIASLNHSYGLLKMAKENRYGI